VARERIRSLPKTLRLLLATTKKFIFSIQSESIGPESSQCQRWCNLSSREYILTELMQSPLASVITD
jgi:hypothetical protein